MQTEDDLKPEVESKTAEILKISELPKPYYQDEHVTLYHGDCRELLPLMPKVDLVLTDPPYGISWKSPHKKYDGNNNKWVDIANDDGSLDLRFLFEYGKNQVVWGAENFVYALPFRGRWICWYKRSDVTKPNTMPSGDFELAWMSKTKGFYKFFQIIHGGVINANSQKGNNEKRLHPTEKPISLMQNCIELFKDIKSVLDPFAGSGTTLIAAKRMGLKVIGIEIEEKYCEVTANRLRQEVLGL
jgi:site-specific DNA-methyltransferase (adenine-specific)